MKTHIARILTECRQHDREEIESLMTMQHAIMAAQEMWEFSPFKNVFYRNGRPVAFAMFTPMTPVTLAASFIATDEFSTVWRQFTTWGLKYFKPTAIEAGFRRVECRTLARHREAIVMLERLGFVMEAEVPDYGLGGETFFQYAWRLSDHVFPISTEDAAGPATPSEGRRVSRG